MRTVAVKGDEAKSGEPVGSGLDHRSRGLGGQVHPGFQRVQRLRGFPGHLLYFRW